MHALICSALGEPEQLTVEEVADPAPGVGQVVIDVEACGVNFPDLLMVQGKYQFTPGLPFSPGGEVSGRIARLGPDVVGLSVGDPVVAVATWGGMATKMVAEASAVTRIPAVDMVTASAFLIAHGTAFHALQDRARLVSGETLLVLGAGGGVGLATVELGRLLGARVIAAASSDDKLRRCRAQGAHHVIDLRCGDVRMRLAELTDGRGVDVCVDPVGGATTETVLRSMAWNGRLLVVGFASGELPRVPLNLPLLKGCSIVGVFWGAFRQREPELYHCEIEQLIAWLHEGRLRPHVSAVVPLHRAREALMAMRERQAVGKIVVELASHRSGPE